MMAIEYDLRCVMVVRKQTSPEKIDALRAMGVELVLVDGDLPPEHPESYNRMARRLAAEIPGAFFPDQHNDRANNEAHYRSTGPEIWRQMDGPHRLVRRRHRHRRHGLRRGALSQGAGSEGEGDGGRHRRLGLHRPLQERPPRDAAAARWSRGWATRRSSAARSGSASTTWCRRPTATPSSPRASSPAPRRSSPAAPPARPSGASASSPPASPPRCRRRSAHRHPVRRLRQPLPLDDLQRRLDRPPGLELSRRKPPGQRRS